MNKLLFSTGLGFFIIEAFGLVIYLLSTMNISQDLLSKIFVFGGIGFINLVFGTLLVIGAIKQ